MVFEGFKIFYYNDRNIHNTLKNSESFKRLMLRIMYAPRLNGNRKTCPITFWKMVWIKDLGALHLNCHNTCCDIFYFHKWILFSIIHNFGHW
jgi:hypothetical protein